MLRWKSYNNVAPITVIIASDFGGASMSPLRRAIG